MKKPAQRNAGERNGNEHRVAEPERFTLTLAIAQGAAHPGQPPRKNPA